MADSDSPSPSPAPTASAASPIVPADQLLTARDRIVAAPAQKVTTDLEVDGGSVDGFVAHIVGVEHSGATPPAGKYTISGPVATSVLAVSGELFVDQGSSVTGTKRWMGVSASDQQNAIYSFLREYPNLSALQVLRVLPDADDLTYQGPEKLSSGQTNVITGSVPVGAAAAARMDPIAAGAAKRLEASGIERVDASVWIDDSGRAVKVVARLEGGLRSISLRATISSTDDSDPLVPPASDTVFPLPMSGTLSPSTSAQP